MQFVNKKYYTNWYLEKNSIKKKKTKLKTFILLENNQPALQCLAKRKRSTELLNLIHKSAQQTN